MWPFDTKKKIVTKETDPNYLTPTEQVKMYIQGNPFLWSAENYLQS